TSWPRSPPWSLSSSRRAPPSIASEATGSRDMATPRRARSSRPLASSLPFWASDRSTIDDWRWDWRLTIGEWIDDQLPVAFILLGGDVLRGHRRLAQCRAS